MVWRLVATYSRRGDLVAALTAHGSAARAATALDRRLTAILTLGNGVPDTAPPAGIRLAPTPRGTIRLLAAPATTLLAALRDAHGEAGLIIGRFPPAAAPWPDDDGIDQWIGACAIALRPGGFLAAEVGALDAAGRYVDHATGLIAAGRRAGLRYHQHLIAIDEHLCERPVRPGPQPALGAADGTGPAVHRRAHTDIVVLHKSGAVDA